MPRHKASMQATLGGTPDEIEATFYEALQSGDIEKLMACWADEDDIVCIHPGGPRLVGAGAIRAASSRCRRAPCIRDGGKVPPGQPAPELHVTRPRR